MTTLEERLANLERNYVALEAKYQTLLEATQKPKPEPKAKITTPPTESEIKLLHHPGHEFLGETAQLDEPFEPLVFHFDKLKAATEGTNPEFDARARLGLADLLYVIETQSNEDRLDAYFKTRWLYQFERKITFEAIWTLFPPGELIYGNPYQGQEQVFVVHDNRVTWPSKARGPWDPWRLKVWLYDWDGRHFARKYFWITFDGFDGPKQITSLPFFPLRYHDNIKEVSERLERRGHAFRDLCTAKKGEQMFQYKGPAFIRRRLPVHMDVGIESQVMVDFLSYKRYGPGLFEMGTLVPNESDQDCRCKQCINNEQLKKTLRSQYDDEEMTTCEWEVEQYMLCPPRVAGYVLRDKQWAQLQVDLVSDAESGSQESYDQVKLAKKDTKDLLLDLVKHHSSTSAKGRIRDIVLNKGNSLVILLYGPPGVGKTTTAETIAIAAKKPLFPVSVTDVGTKAQNVERNLEKIFDLAAQWEAILLIDEADVFLESRSKGRGFNTERNALVSGILFLTTNQIAQFDVAVQSRIHIALKYEQLNEAQTEAIFAQFLNQLNVDNRVDDMAEIMRWVRSEVIRRKYGFDGRQIRNVVSCAMTLAKARRKKLGRDEVVEVVDYVRDFKTEFKLQFDRYLISQAGQESQGV
ncbi:hypothetical protein N0V90_011561 [Kalmusia sp. IMI 367209]|nr:hypothetical protein N0V90_011561 [Kalmusia sp. IMI 367209]